jgi:hypothetical protein
MSIASTEGKRWDSSDPFDMMGGSQFPTWGTNSGDAPAQKQADVVPASSNAVVKNEAEVVPVTATADSSSITSEFWHPAGALAESAPEGPNPYEKMLQGDDQPATHHRRAWEDEATPAPTAAPVVEKTEEWAAPVVAKTEEWAAPVVAKTEEFASPVKTEEWAAPVIAKAEDNTAPASSSYKFDLDAAVSPMAATVPPAQQHAEKPWSDVFSGGSQALETVTMQADSPVVEPAKPLTMGKLDSASSTLGGGGSFAMWSAMKSFDNMDSLSSSADAQAAATVSNSHKESDWSALANGGLWGDSTGNADGAPAFSALQADQPHDDMSRMSHMLQSNSLLQRSKKGMVSIKLHRVKA